MRAGRCNLYRRLIRPLLFRLDPETAHRLTLAMLGALPAWLAPEDPPELAVNVWDQVFSNPVGLAAGVDKDARAIAGWQALGFGFAEVGTVTPRPQPGNPRPRLWRLSGDRALINRMGFPSAGMEAVARSLERVRPRTAGIRLGVNVGPNRDTPVERVPEDYQRLIARLGPMADFVVVNLSSPNTPGLRDWQGPERIRTLGAALTDAQAGLARRPPVLVKLAPDLEDALLADLCAAILDSGFGGMVAVNTTVSRAGLAAGSYPEGGLSGPPLRARARETVAHLYRLSGGKLAIIGVGGVASAEDAYALIRAGASLVELYTALVYDGPAAVRMIKSGLKELLRRDGWRSIGEAVGSGSSEQS